MQTELREHLRVPVEYLAELWVSETFEKDNYSDIGFRGSIKDISPTGVSFGNFINLNLMGVQFGTAIRRDSLVKLVIYTSGERVESIGKVAWVKDENGSEAMGVYFEPSVTDSPFLKLPVSSSYVN